MKSLLSTLALLAFVAVAPQADAASIQYSLKTDTCTNGCGNGSTTFGTVTLTQTLSSIVDVKVELISPTKFVAGTSLAFDLAGFTLVSTDISGLTSGFAFNSGPVFMNGALGTFDYGITCVVPTGCGNGASNPNPGPLDFTITKTGLTLNSFTTSSGGSSGAFIFASDVQGDRKSTRLNSSHVALSRMPSSA